MLRSHRHIVVMALTLWVLAGLAAAFGGCAAMAAMCDGLCPMFLAAIGPVPPLDTFGLTAIVAFTQTPAPPARVPQTTDPPPKLLFA